MDSFINGVLERWMANATLAAIGKPYLDVAPVNPPATYAVFSIKSNNAKSQGHFDRTSIIDIIAIEFTVYSSAGLERQIQSAIHNNEEDEGFDFASFAIDNGHVLKMHRFGQPVGYAGTDPTSQKHIYFASSLYEATVQTFVSTP